MHTFIIQLITVTIICNYQINTQEVKYKIRAPEFICQKDGSVKEIKPNATTVKISDQNIGTRYAFSVDFMRTGCKCKNLQRCTLMAWRAVRELNQYLERYPFKDGTVQITNKMLVPGFQYFIVVTVMNPGSMTYIRRIVLDYGEDKTEEEKLMIKPHLELLGAKSTYAYMPYIVNAEMVPCTNMSEYHFQWYLLDDKSKIIQKFKEKGSQLRVPPDTLRGNRTYGISCNVMEKQKLWRNVISKFTIMSKGISVNIPVKTLSVSPEQPVKIRAFMRDFDNLEDEFKTTWSCIDSETSEACQFIDNKNEMEIDSGFGKDGQYAVNFKATKGQYTDEDSCSITVTSYMPSVEIEEIENPVNPSLGVEIRAKIYQIRSFCKLQWVSVTEEGYDDIDMDSVPGNVGKRREIIVRDDLFLKELEEFSNDTVDRDHDLIIPPPSDDWVGLQGDSQYLFRLIVSCPPRIQDYDDNAEDEPVIEDTDTYSDVVVITNSAPAVASATINPVEGVAFNTKFQVTSDKAEDLDGPVLYKFGYELNQFPIIAMSMFDVLSAEFELPYAEQGLKVFVEACDGYGLCAKSFVSTISTFLPPEYATNIFKEKILQKFRRNFDLEEYYRGLSAAFNVLDFYKTINNSEIFQECQNVIYGRILGEIQKWLDSKNDDKSSARNLVKTANEFGTVLELPGEILDKLLDLSNHLSDVDLVPPNRPKRSILVKRQISILEDMKTHIKLNELRISHSNDSNKIKENKQVLLQQLDGYLKRLCRELFEKNQVIRLEFDTFLISLEKANKISFNSLLPLPFERNVWNITGRLKLGLSNYNANRNKICLSKGIFENYLDADGYIFYARIFPGDDGEDVENIHDVMLLIPYDKNQLGEPQCKLYDNDWKNECKTVKKTASYVQCLCKTLGYFRLQYDGSTTSTATTVTTTKTPPRSKSSAITTVIPTTTAVVILDPSIPTIEVFQNTSNSSSEQMIASGNYETVSYIVIVGSVIGIICLGFILRKLLHEDDEDDAIDDFDFPKYAQLYDEEILQDAHM